MVVPEGSWYCPECCDDNFQRDIIEQYFHDIQHQRFDYCLQNNVLHPHWLEYHYNSYRPLFGWTPCHRIELPVSEIHIFLQPSNIIGYPICVHMNLKLIRGRIISYRYDDKLCYHEHLIQFKSGNGDLNAPLIRWINLEEHDVLLGGEVIWVKKGSGYPWQLAQIHYRSGLHILKRQLEINTNYKKVYIFDDDKCMDLPISSFIPFHKYEGKVKQRSSRRTNVSFALAMVEVEEQESARRALEYFTPKQLLNYGGLPDGLKVHHLKSFTDNPSTIYGQFEIKHAYNMCSASHDISARLKRGNILALDGLYMLAEGLLLESTDTTCRSESLSGVAAMDGEDTAVEAVSASSIDHACAEVDVQGSDEKDLSADQITELERFVSEEQEDIQADEVSEEFVEQEEGEGSVSSGEVGDIEGSVDNSVDLSGVFQQVEPSLYAFVKVDVISPHRMTLSIPLRWTRSRLTTYYSPRLTCLSPHLPILFLDTRRWSSALSPRT